MSSYQFLNNHSTSSSLYSNKAQQQPTSCCCSTTQNCLFKILKTISTIPSSHNNNNNNTIEFPTSQNGVKKKESNSQELFPIDLNASFCEAENSCGVTMEEEKLQEDDDNGVSKNRKLENFEEENKGFMGLLIEAARLIFGEFKDDDDDDDDMDDPEKKFHRRKQVKRKNKCWGVEYVNEETTVTAPVVRSKRGRIQVLPYKYRDSVIEPLTRFSRNRDNIVGTSRRNKIGTIERRLV